MTDNTQEHRISERISVDLEVEILRQGEAFRGTVLNCSLSGVFMRTNRKLETSEILDVRIYLPDRTEPIAAQSRVIWTDWNEMKEMPGFGMSFLSLTEDQALRLRRFLYE